MSVPSERRHARPDLDASAAGRRVSDASGRERRERNATQEGARRAGPSPVQSPDRAKGRPPRYSRWRAGTLLAVHGLIALHILHWKLAGKTLAPVELNEVVYTLELGVVTAGFVFMALAVLATGIFGRFFCSWGCHLLALQDLCAWLLAKIRIRPRPIRSRVLQLVPFLAMGSMFVWPQLLRIVAGRPLPQVRVLTDAEGWGSFVTSDFWRNLPGPWIAVLTFAICGFAMVYLLGTRAFCIDVCPYGAVFSVVDRLAPGRIVLLQGDCTRCGICTAVCQSHVRVHEEVGVYGKVVNSACLKDLDCVSACPQGALGYGFSRPALFQSLRPSQGMGRRTEFTVLEEAGMAATFVACVLIFRGLYGAVPFLMSLGISVIAAYLVVVSARLIRRRDVRLGRLWLKRGTHWTGSGRFFAAAACLLGAFVVHSAWVRYREVCSHRAVERFEQGALSADAGRHAEAVEHFHAALALDPALAPAHYNLGVVLERLGRTAEAASAYRSALALDPDDAESHNNLGLLLLEQRELEAAEGHFRGALARRPSYAQAHFNLGQLLLLRGQTAEALGHIEQAARMDRRYSAFLGWAQERRGP